MAPTLVTTSVAPVLLQHFPSGEYLSTAFLILALLSVFAVFLEILDHLFDVFATVYQIINLQIFHDAGFEKYLV